MLSLKTYGKQQQRNYIQKNYVCLVGYHGHIWKDHIERKKHICTTSNNPIHYSVKGEEFLLLSSRTWNQLTITITECFV